MLMIPIKRCPKCEFEKYVTDFYKKLDGFSSRCKVCTEEDRHTRY